MLWIWNIVVYRSDNRLCQCMKNCHHTTESETAQCCNDYDWRKLCNLWPIYVAVITHVLLTTWIALELYLNFPEFKVVTQYNSPNSLVQEHYVQRATRTVGDVVEALDNHVREIRTFHDIKAWKFETNPQPQQKIYPLWFLVIRQLVFVQLYFKLVLFFF